MAFLVPALSILRVPGRLFARVLVVSPSRELAHQTLRQFELLRGKKPFKGRLLDKSTASDQNLRRVDLAMATPLRLIQLLRDARVSLHHTQLLIVDEADKMFDTKFVAQLDEILSNCTNKKLQIAMFSATLPDNIISLAESVMHQPSKISIGTPNSAARGIKQELMFVTSDEGKLTAFRQLVRDGRIKPPTLVFVQSKDRAQELFNELVFDGIYVDVIHADRTNAQRDALIESFRSLKVWVLICTDLMARGVDFKGVQVVVSYDFPQSSSAYIHRVGRTGRAGHAGEAITMFTTEDAKYLSVVIGVMRQSGCRLPDWLQGIKKLTPREKRRLQRNPLTRKSVSTLSEFDIQSRVRKQRRISRSRAKSTNKTEHK